MPSLPPSFLPSSLYSPLLVRDVQRREVDKAEFAQQPNHCPVQGVEPRARGGGQPAQELTGLGEQKVVDPALRKKRGVGEVGGRGGAEW
jgi:hypothetical protein